MHRIYPSSPTAWMHQDLSDGSREQDSQIQLDVPDSRYRSWTDGDAVDHEHQANGSPGLGRREQVRRKELRGTGVLEAMIRLRSGIGPRTMRRPLIPGTGGLRSRPRPV